nr:GNAT family N-acetyltransferase [Propionicimonas sp.]
MIRTAVSDDHREIVAVIDQWWGRPLSGRLQPLVLEHFCDTSLVAEDEHGLAGFLVGFLSSARPDEAYIHFAGVRPDLRGGGLGKELYATFFRRVRERGRSVVTCITSPVNQGSIAFHRAIGFEATVPADDDSHVRFRKELVGRL